MIRIIQLHTLNTSIAIATTVSLCDSSSDKDDESNPPQQDTDEVADLQEPSTDTEGTSE